MQPFPDHSVLKSSGRSTLKLPESTRFKLFSSCCRPAVGRGPSVHFSPNAPALWVCGRQSIPGPSHFFPLSGLFLLGLGLRKGTKKPRRQRASSDMRSFLGVRGKCPSAFSLIRLGLLCLMWLLGIWGSLRCPSTCLGFSGL